MARSEKPGKTLRKLAGLAYERELTQELEAVARQFDRWREGGISCWDLSDLIHEFHDGVSRELFKHYNYAAPEVTVARAVSADILAEDEVSRAALDRIQMLIDSYRGESPTDEWRGWESTDE